jgi:Ankyrin repeats (3 copies)
VKERPPNEDDDIDEQYRRASARDASRPSEPVRRAVLRHAAELAAQRAAGRGPIAPDELADDAGHNGELGPVKFDIKRPAANEWRWRPAAYGGLAAAALAGLLIAPHFLPPAHAPVSSSPPAARSASKKTEAPPVTALETPRAPAPETSPAAPLPMAQRVPRPAPSSNAPPAPRPDVPAGTSGASSAAADAASAVAAKPRAFAEEPPPARALGSGALSAFVATRARAPIDSATALRQAAQGGDLSRLKALLDEQIEVDARDPTGRTALMLAVIGGQAQAVDMLLARGADPNVADSSGATPLAAALAASHADIAAALRRAGAH